MPNIKKLGDAHLGKSFKNGVPLHQRGVREKMQGRDLEKSLSDLESIDTHVTMGDLFDRAVVPFEVIIKAAETYRRAAARHPDTLFVILRGNHDASRDLQKRSAFDVFDMLLDGTDNVMVLKEPFYSEDGLAFIPWDPLLTSAELVAEIPEGTHTVFGHWDTRSYGGSEDNMIPFEALKAKGVKTIYTGHIHKPEVYTAHDMEVNVVGSMQPYAHGEEVNDDLYITVDLETAKLGGLESKCVRVDLKPGDTIDFGIDCLQLTTRRLDEKGEPENIEVTLGDFDFMAMFDETLDTLKASDEVKDKIREKYTELRGQQC
jgi:DNA repair exonuclease SbcCD nuclease subunit